MNTPIQERQQGRVDKWLPNGLDSAPTISLHMAVNSPTIRPYSFFEDGDIKRKFQEAEPSTTKAMTAMHPNLTPFLVIVLIGFPYSLLKGARRPGLCAAKDRITAFAPALSSCGDEIKWATLSRFTHSSKGRPLFSSSCLLLQAL